MSFNYDYPCHVCVLASECSFDFLDSSDRNRKMHVRDYIFEKCTLRKNNPAPTAFCLQDKNQTLICTKTLSALINS